MGFVSSVQFNYICITCLFLARTRNSSRQFFVAQRFTLLRFQHRLTMEFCIEKAHCFYAYVEMQNGISDKDIHRKLTAAFPDDAPSYSTVSLWCKNFRKNSRTSWCDLPRSGRPRTSRSDENIGRIQQMLQINPKYSCRQLSDQLEISKDTVLQILTDDLKMRKLCSVWIPHALTEVNKRQRVVAAQRILQELDELGADAARLYCAVEDETWVDFNPKLPKQENKCWVQHAQQRSTVVRPKLTNQKTLLLFCFTSNKVYAESLPYGETVDSQRYVSFIRSVGEHWRVLRRDPTKLCDLSFQHDNARPHTSAVTAQFFRQRRVKMVGQPPYSPDYNLCDRWVFAHLKSCFKKMTFHSHEEVKDAALQVFRDIPVQRFQSELDKLRHHLLRVIDNNGCYVT